MGTILTLSMPLHRIIGKGPLPVFPALHGTEANGAQGERYCKYCYQGGDFTAKGVDLGEFIEAAAQIEADAMGITREEAVSLVVALLRETPGRPCLSRTLDA
ncbi:zinc ribbon domain-containing protein [uncultured Adlercreutzia sp.]|uniref:zinc ribbon domain-containing protein n=2 Tax=uncultured Adlercreutzia sp. TaxID=875803 RepID=UPI0025D0BDBB|nr:zinc ribbon domain-containing protein [uncultured Adlercreutzia sp.]